MARRVFFSFHYDYIFRVNQIRNAGSIIGSAAAGFQDASLWESSKGSPDYIRRLIREGLNNTSVTVCLITHGIHDRPYVNYEMENSLARGNGLVGIQIHHLKDPHKKDHRVGRSPPQILENGFKIYKYTTASALVSHIEEAARLAGR